MTWLLVPSVLVASLLGSLHCAAMCGAFACMASDRDGQTDLRLQAPYQGGRLIAYLILGALAGSAGAALNTVGWRAGLAQAASLGMGLLLVAWGGARLLQLRRQAGHTSATTPQWWQRMAGGWLQRVAALPPSRRAALTGLVTGLLPCGWLWVFVAVASGTGHATSGMLVMAVFWLGSVPALVGVVIGARHLGARWRQRLPTISATLILTLGIVSLANHLGWLPMPTWMHPGMPSGLSSGEMRHG